MSSIRTTRDPLAPIESIVSLALTALVTLLVLVAALTAFGANTIFGAWGSSLPCIDHPQAGLVTGGDGENPLQVMNLRPGVTVGFPEHFRLCQAGMSAGDRTLASLPAVLWLVWVIGFLVLVLLLVRRARRGGLFTHDVARGATRLGWYILLGYLVVDAAGALLRATVAAHLVSGYSLLTGVGAMLQWNWATIFGGFACLSIGRVMAQAVPMREEIEATV